MAITLVLENIFRPPPHKQEPTDRTLNRSRMYMREIKKLRAAQLFISPTYIHIYEELTEPPTGLDSQFGSLA